VGLDGASVPAVAVAFEKSGRSARASARTPRRSRPRASSPAPRPPSTKPTAPRPSRTRRTRPRGGGAGDGRSQQASEDVAPRLGLGPAAAVSDAAALDEQLHRLPRVERDRRTSAPRMAVAYPPRTRCAASAAAPARCWDRVRTPPSQRLGTVGGPRAWGVGTASRTAAADEFDGIVSHRRLGPGPHESAHFPRTATGRILGYRLRKACPRRIRSRRTRLSRGRSPRPRC
jgi:hypothetical protein